MCAEAVRVSGAVPALVAGADQPRDCLHSEVRCEQPLSDDRVQADELPFLAGELARVAEHSAGHRHVADVTQTCRRLEVVEIIDGYSEALADPGRERADVVARA